MADRTQITPEMRQQAVSAAGAAAVFLSEMLSKLRAGRPDLPFILWIISALPAVSAQLLPAIKGGVLASAALAGETLDAFTGSDLTALPFADADTFSYMTPAEQEAFFDSFKALVEQAAIRAFEKKLPGGPPA